MGKIGKGIKILLKKKNLTQKDLSEMTNLSETSISLVMKGHTYPRAGTLEKVSKALNVKTEIILLLSIDKEDITEDRKQFYDIIWDTIESSILALFVSDG